MCEILYLNTIICFKIKAEAANILVIIPHPSFCLPLPPQTMAEIPLKLKMILAAVFSHAKCCHLIEDWGGEDNKLQC